MCVLSEGEHLPLPNEEHVSTVRHSVDQPSFPRISHISVGSVLQLGSDTLSVDTPRTMAPLYARDFVYPPLDGSITIPETIEFHWKHNADLPAFAFSRDGQEYAESITEISFLEFGRACHRVAHYIDSKFQSEGGRPVVALIALTDTLVYQATCVGIMKAGFIVSLPTSCLCSLPL